MSKYSQFVADSFLLGGKYRFHEETFSIGKVKTKITCLVHGDFWQAPANHINRQSKCPECSKALVGRKSSLGHVEVKKRLQEVLGNRYKILKAPANIMGLAEILCSRHGCTYEVQVSGLINKKDCRSGCPKCNRKLTLNDLVADSFLQFKGRFKLLSNSRYPTYKLSGWCVKHGDFTTYKTNILKTKWGCPRCNEERTGRVANRKSGITQHQALIDLFYYTKFRGQVLKCFKNETDVLLDIVCPVHGESRITWKVNIKKVNSSKVKSSLHKWGCRDCSAEGVTVAAKFSRVINRAPEFYKEAASANPHMKVVSEYKGANELIKVQCDKGHITDIRARRLLGNNGFKTNCETCYGKYAVSQPELEMRAALDSFGIEYLSNDRGTLDGKELDIYIPSLNLAVEYNGVIWHSEKYTADKFNMNNKRLLCESKGIRLININSSDNFKVAMQLILSAAGCNHERVFARKCKIVKTSTKDPAVKKILDDTHIQGKVPGCSAYCLTYNDEIVSVMCFSLVNSERGKKRDQSRYELRRYAGYGSVVGGASKLLKAFIRDNRQCREIISYSDNRVFVGGMYEKLGFDLVSESKPDYGYTRNGQFLFHKAKFRRARLEARDDIDFRQEETEVVNCKRNGWYRFWDCGKKKWVMGIP